MLINSPVTPNRLDSREGLLAELAIIDAEGWDGPAGQRLLGHVRSRIVRPQVVAAGLRGPAADQAEATGWAAAWEVLSRPEIRAAASPWGLLWVAVRRAVLGEVVAAVHLAGVRNGWRAEHSRQECWRGTGQHQPSDPPVSLAVLIEHGWEPEAQPIESGVDLGPRLEQVVSALVRAGWQPRSARAVVEGVAVTAVRDGKSSAEAVGWRPLARRLGLPPWQVRRVTVLLLGAPGWPGLVERMTAEGCHILDDRGIAAALRSTALSGSPPPPVAAGRRGRPARTARTRAAS